MNKSYKMILLKYMLSRGPEDWYKAVSPIEVAPFFHSFLMEKEYRFKADFSDAKGQQLREYDEKKMVSLISSMPMTKWSGSAKDHLINFKDEIFKLNIYPSIQENEIVYLWTEEIVTFRLHNYFEKNIFIRTLKSSI